MLALAWTISMDAQGIIRQQTQVKKPKGKTEHTAKAKAKTAPKPKKRVERKVEPKPEPKEPVEVKNQVTKREDPPPVEMTPTQVIEKLIADMVYIPGGTFTMYDRNFYPGYTGHCPAAFSAKVDGFYLCRYEVTQQLWQAVMDFNPSQDAVGNRPVECFNWDEAQLFIYRLNQITGLKFRLPTEEEWQWAYDEGKSPRQYKYSGSNEANEVGWTEWNSEHRAHAVGMLKPNALGLYDMTGNVGELCTGHSGIEYISAYSQKDHRVERGCFYNDTDLGSGERKAFNIVNNYINKARPNPGTGLRLALNQLPKSVSIHLDKTPQPTSQREIVAQLVKDMVRIPGGTFTMSYVFPENRNSSKGWADMDPHQVTLDTYYLCRYEVTQRLWQAVMGNNPSKNKDDLDQPVTNVGCKDIKQFIAKLNAISGQQFRLPTEAEWEYACIGGREKPVSSYSGDELVDGTVRLVACWDYDLKKPQAVGKLIPNVLGLYDMTGNVAELCSDLFSVPKHKHLYNVPNVPKESKHEVNPKGPNPSDCLKDKPKHTHVYRGGDYKNLQKYKDRWRVSYPSDDIGFRLAASTIRM